jgi:hypothetical protein
MWKRLLKQECKKTKSISLVTKMLDSVRDVGVRCMCAKELFF